MKFEDLKSWAEARVLVRRVYELTRKPGLATDFGLSSQIQRAAVSVMSNVAEGFERGHKAEKIQAYRIARGSCGEVRSILYVVMDAYPALAKEVPPLQAQAITTGMLISGLIRSTEGRPTFEDRKL